ncbi:GspH/FimT family pseudopilin [Deinococcus peraridilitoris]|uniref:General secretion pathway protein H n=1 Tax=Deinococcus peraridilitoris (strain DSM 19664 / LMG 22246 / CIP 109416 / KR-200) TaxID=937777 RepID=L0A386_DEIPD|nr:GspH/FimT family pseudopilin [Deinococcus peraridilitoris]AFZ67475.1 general secretion pathway protein H [Deinococcus peraridilitoris DSM 19664]
MRHTSGFSLLELLIVIGIVGVLAAIVPLTIRRDQIQTRQAANLLAQQIQLSRFEAVRRNRFAGIYFPANGLSFIVYEDTNNDRTYTSSGDTTIQTYNLRSGDYAKTQLQLSAAATILFDPRSFLVNTAAPGTVTTFRMQSTDNSNYVWRVEVTTQGRVIRVIQ